MRLSPVLADADLSPAELQAARLDGELYDLAGAYCLLGELEAPRHRARAVLAGRSPRLIAELGTAAWIWGAVDTLDGLEFAVTPDARARLGPAHHATVREIVYEAGDVTALDDCQVTTPLRTVIDLARNDFSFDPTIAERLASLGGFDIRDCVASLQSRHGIPSKARALENLRRMLTP
jgi:hypothetical protein